MVGMQGHYFTSFKVPDTYGVYKFVVSYHRPGYTALDVVKRVSSPSMLASSLLFCKCVSSESCWTFSAVHSGLHLCTSGMPLRCCAWS